MKTHLFQMQNLDGVRGGRRKGEFFRSFSAAMRIIREGRVATAANDNGAINIYRRDDGLYHCTFCRHWCELSVRTFRAQRYIKNWLKTWYPRMS